MEYRINVLVIFDYWIATQYNNELCETTVAEEIYIAELDSYNILNTSTQVLFSKTLDIHSKRWFEFQFEHPYIIHSKIRLHDFRCNLFSYK